MLRNDVQCYQFGDYRLDVTNCQLFRSGESVSVTQKSFEILRFLVENRGRILKKEEFLESLWEGSYVEEANLTQHIYMLRKALKQNRNGEVFIETIPKNGYRFVPDVEEIVSENRASKPVQFRGRENVEAKNVSNRPQFGSRTFGPLTLSLGTLFVVLLAGGFFYFAKNLRASTAADIGNKSVAVLPFTQIGEKKDAKLGVGVADVLIARLANIAEIDVRPTTSILRFDGEDNSDLSEVGKKLGVDCVIEGSIQRHGGVVRITAQLFDVKQKQQVWTEKFDEEYRDIFTLQDKISEKITRRLSNSGAPIEQAFLPYKQYTRNPEAYRAYSMGCLFGVCIRQMAF